MIIRNGEWRLTLSCRKRNSPPSLSAMKRSSIRNLWGQAILTRSPKSRAAGLLPLSAWQAPPRRNNSRERRKNALEGLSAKRKNFGGSGGRGAGGTSHRDEKLHSFFPQRANFSQDFFREIPGKDDHVIRRLFEKARARHNRDFRA